MRSDSFRHRSAALLLFEAIDPAPSSPVFRPTPRPQLPLYVEPAQDEALLSWLLRLASRLQVSLHALASLSFGIDDRSGRSHWWCRPNRWLLNRISERTGVSIARLRRMTFEQLEPEYREDEVSGRFCGRIYDTWAPGRRAYRFAACGACLEGDAKPYLRPLWLIGWMAVCPEHGAILIERCPMCRARLRVAPFGTASSFSPTLCTRCGESLLDGVLEPAHPDVLRLQDALLKAKTCGVAELGGLGRFSWEEMVALADVLIGMTWTDTTMAEREVIHLRYTYEDLNRPKSQRAFYDSRHDSLRFLAWLIDGWPTSPGAEVGRNMLIRWLNGERNRICRPLCEPRDSVWTQGPSNFGPAIRDRLQLLIG
jgi:hypothetical protein